ncbi:type VII secretion protein EccCa [Streptomyces griseoluteus]|uniref:Type VII secretion protein EccCa n=1 Tax=Streptomyces griseoluteus TaxID=29306 RepID=A0A4Z1DSA9_STRGP|nr:type VII secretion protein EccCa [Streptomyces griseoluteus]TGN87810.1 type VII secretion protein EccCa [Streptomyces griseoluteus]GHF24384.1 type VII secretion protein EccC [Streptomyces griseoluteus]
MSQLVIKRPPRALPPEVPSEEVQLEAPPELPRGQQEGMLMQVLPTLGMGSSVVFYFASPNAHPFMRIMGVVMLVSTAAMVVSQIVRHRRGTQGQMADVRRDYLRYLAQTRRTVRRTALRQRDAQLYLHPAPEQLWSLVAEGSRVWERRVADEDFGQVRIGLGPQQLATPLMAPQTAPVDELEPLCAGAMQRFLSVHGQLDGLPVALSLRAFYHVTVSGDPERAQSAARALVAQATTLHSPDDLIVAVVASRGAADRWDWTKWLPHCQLPGQFDGAGTRRLVSDDLGELEQLLAGRLEERPRFSRGGQPLLDQPHILVVLDGGIVPPSSAFAAAEGLQGVTIVEVVSGELDTPRGDLSIVVRSERLRLDSGGEVAFEGTPDGLSLPGAEALARQLAPLRMGGGDDDEPLLSNLDFTDLLGLGDAASVDVRRTWRPRSMSERLRVPIGVGEDGQPVMLDLKEAAQDGMGPHGLCVGATGSGKSELLRTLVLGLAVTHSSETLNFVLADFKGGATFAGMSQMPHVAAVITNLSDDLTLVDRMGDAIRGELQRRQELLRAAGNYANIHDYEKARAAGAPLEPLASLVLVIDEFSELLTAKPDFIDMFIQIGRIGRSLGVHLLLASQRLEEGRLRGLDTYLSYRVGLRTFSAAESRAALGVPDAYHLPSVPGSGYLKFGTDEMTRFKAAYVSGTYRAGGAEVTGGSAPVERRPARFTALPVPMAHVAPDPAEERARAARAEDDALADTVLDVIVQRLDGQGVPAHQVWLPPLDEAPALDHLLPALSVSPERGLHAPEYPRAGALTVPLGLIDKPFEQKREVLYRDFSGAAGHMMVVGGPQSGKSTLLRSLVASFALTHTPLETQFYCLDFGGGGLASLADLPHVGGVASRLDPERVRRTVAEVAGILNRREQFFRTNGIDSVATYRRRRAAGELPGEAWGDVFLVIDGWGNFKTEYEGLEGVVNDIAGRGLGYGIHVVVSASRYMEVRAALKDQILSRLELRLGDPMDSEFDRKVAVNVPAGVPGRGQVSEKLHFMTALPRIDGSSSAGDLSEATAALVQRVKAGWEGPAAPTVRLLPRKLPADQLPKGFEFPQAGFAIGIDEASLEPVFVDLDTDPFFLVFGESESGKTNLLRLIAKQITERYTPAEARIVVGDYRRTMLEAVGEEHLLEYAPMASAMQVHMDAIRQFMEMRAPKPDITPQQLRDRSWWSGPQLFVIIDDYELVATNSGNPLSQLVEHLPFARDVGVKFIIARSQAGASRAMYESFMQRVKELGAQGVVLSGDPSEGDILGTVRARPMPPGRGVFVSRKRGTSLIQLGLLPQRH